LLAALRAGDQDAFTTMVERHSSTIYNLALRLTNSPQEAEEVLQETFLNAFRAIDRFEGRSQLSTWLYRIAYNASLMRLRKKTPSTVSIDDPLTDDEGAERPRQLVAWGPLPDEAAVSAELQVKLNDAVQRLPTSLKTVFVLRDIEGLSTQETAETLGLTETNVKVRLHRARLALRESLSGYMAAAATPQG
jgi:RNA polymerase sigma-70 factor, ECF subfamily